MNVYDRLNNDHMTVYMMIIMHFVGVYLNDVIVSQRGGSLAAAPFWVDNNTRVVATHSRASLRCIGVRACMGVNVS